MMRKPTTRKKRGKPRYGRLEWRVMEENPDVLTRRSWPHMGGSVWYRRLRRTHIITAMSHVAIHSAKLDRLDFIELRRYVDRAGSLVAVRK